jgi:hypothetical protein
MAAGVKLLLVVVLATVCLIVPSAFGGSTSFEAEEVPQPAFVNPGNHRSANRHVGFTVIDLEERIHNRQGVLSA